MYGREINERASYHLPDDKDIGPQYSMCIKYIEQSHDPYPRINCIEKLAVLYC